MSIDITYCSNFNGCYIESELTYRQEGNLIDKITDTLLKDCDDEGHYMYDEQLLIEKITYIVKKHYPNSEISVEIVNVNLIDQYVCVNKKNKKFLLTAH